MPQAKKILVLRFSAMGDVAMTVPVLQEVVATYPEVSLVVVSRKAFEPFFDGIPRVAFHAFEPNTKHRGILGLFRLFKELKTHRAFALADLHENLRTRILRSLFRLTSTPIAILNKGRAEKKALTRKENKINIPLKSTFERYADVFASLGYPILLKNTLSRKPETLTQAILKQSGTKGNEKWIGVSPFAQHAQKVYPLDKMENVSTALALRGHRIFVFGGGKEEQKIAENWAKKNKNITSLIGKLSLKEELTLISNLDVMLSMDSSGMHLASLKGIPVVSVWGATHPNAGFVGYGQTIQNCVQLDLSCRPCSIYGNKPCHRGDFACMNFLPEEAILSKLETVLNQ